MNKLITSIVVMALGIVSFSQISRGYQRTWINNNLEVDGHGLPNYRSLSIDVNDNQGGTGTFTGNTQNRFLNPDQNGVEWCFLSNDNNSPWRRTWFSSSAFDELYLPKGLGNYANWSWIGRNNRREQSGGTSWAAVGGMYVFSDMNGKHWREDPWSFHVVKSSSSDLSMFLPPRSVYYEGVENNRRTTHSTSYHFKVGEENGLLLGNVSYTKDPYSENELYISQQYLLDCDQNSGSYTLPVYGWSHRFQCSTFNCEGMFSQEPWYPHGKNSGSKGVTQIDEVTLNVYDGGIYTGAEGASKLGDEVTALSTADNIFVIAKSAAPINLANLIKDFADIHVDRPNANYNDMPEVVWTLESSTTDVEYIITSSRNDSYFGTITFDPSRVAGLSINSDPNNNSDNIKFKFTLTQFFDNKPVETEFEIWVRHGSKNHWMTSRMTDDGLRYGIHSDISQFPEHAIGNDINEYESFRICSNESSWDAGSYVYGNITHASVKTPLNTSIAGTQQDSRSIDINELVVNNVGGTSNAAGDQLLNMSYVYNEYEALLADWRTTWETNMADAWYAARGWTEATWDAYYVNYTATRVVPHMRIESVVTDEYGQEWVNVISIPLRVNDANGDRWDVEKNPVDICTKDSPIDLRTLINTTNAKSSLDINDITIIGNSGDLFDPQGRSTGSNTITYRRVNTSANLDVSCELTEKTVEVRVQEASEIQNNMLTNIGDYDGKYFPQANGNSAFAYCEEDEYDPIEYFLDVAPVTDDGGSGSWTGTTVTGDVYGRQVGNETRYYLSLGGAALYNEGVSDSIITYTYTNQYGCISSLDIEVYKYPTLDIEKANNEQVWFCKSETSVDLRDRIEMNYTGGNWTGLSGGNIVNFSTVSVGPQTLTYTYSEPNKFSFCNSSGDIQVEVRGVPARADVDLPSTICYQDELELTATAGESNEQASSHYVWWQQGIENPVHVQPGSDENYSITAIEDETYFVAHVLLTDISQRDDILNGIWDVCPSEQRAILIDVESPQGQVLVDEDVIAFGTPVSFEFDGEDVVEFDWSFGNGLHSYQSDPVHYFYQSGTFDVDVIITSQSGCADTLTNVAQITVGDQNISTVASGNSSSINGIANAYYTMFPSITNSQVELTFYNADVTGSIVFVSADGSQRRVFEAAGKTTNINVEDMSSGVWLVNANINGNTEFLGKVVITK